MKILINGGNLRNGHFRIDRTSNFFPVDSWGGNNQASAARPVRFVFEGTNEEVDTDIDGRKRIPRLARGEIDRFFKHYRVKEGEVIELTGTSDRRFIVQVVREVSLSIPSAASVTPPTPLGSESPTRSTVSVDRIIRETAVTDYVKRLYQFKCQVCGLALLTRRGLYAEGAHIRPLGAPHDGPDQTSNVLCLCPNHHVMLDGGTLSVNDNHSLVGASGVLLVHVDHKIDLAHLRYHRSSIASAP